MKDVDTVKKSITLGVDDYVLKPIDLKLLLKKIDKVFLAKDSQRWNVPVSETLSLEAQIEVQVTGLSEDGLLLKAPVKIPKGHEVKIRSFEFNVLGLNQLHQRSELEHSYSYGKGLFLTEIRFLKITPAQSAGLRKFITLRKSG